MTTIQTFAFTDGNTANGGTGHQIDLGSGLSTNQVDVLGVVCDAVVDTPSGWTDAPDDVAVAAMYVFRRTSAASGLVTIHTSADRPCSIAHVRLNAVSTVDDAKKNVVSSSSGTTTPTVTSATLAAAGEAVVAFALLHNFATAPAAPVWSSGFTGLDTSGADQFKVSTDGTASHSTAIAAAVNLSAGTAAVSASATFTNAASERGAMLLTWQAVTPGGITVQDYGAAPGAVTLTPAVLQLAAVALTATPGPVTVTLTPAVLVLAAVALSIPGDHTVHRPNTGTVIRPSTGTVTRPFSGTVTRP